MEWHHPGAACWERIYYIRSRACPRKWFSSALHFLYAIKHDNPLVAEEIGWQDIPKVALGNNWNYRYNIINIACLNRVSMLLIFSIFLTGKYVSLKCSKSWIKPILGLYWSAMYIFSYCRTLIIHSAVVLSLYSWACLMYETGISIDHETVERAWGPFPMENEWI